MSFSFECFSFHFLLSFPENKINFATTTTIWKWIKIENHVLSLFISIEPPRFSRRSFAFSFRTPNKKDDFLLRFCRELCSGARSEQCPIGKSLTKQSFNMDFAVVEFAAFLFRRFYFGVCRIFFFICYHLRSLFCWRSLYFSSVVLKRQTKSGPCALLAIWFVYSTMKSKFSIWFRMSSNSQFSFLFFLRVLNIFVRMW